MCCMLCAACYVLRVMCCVLCAMCYVLCAMCYVLCAMCYAMCCVLWDRSIYRFVWQLCLLNHIMADVNQPWWDVENIAITWIQPKQFTGPRRIIFRNFVRRGLLLFIAFMFFIFSSVVHSNHGPKNEKIVGFRLPKHFLPSFPPLARSCFFIHFTAYYSKSTIVNGEHQHQPQQQQPWLVPCNMLWLQLWILLLPLQLWLQLRILLLIPL